MEGSSSILGPWGSIQYAGTHNASASHLHPDHVFANGKFVTYKIQGLCHSIIVKDQLK